MEACRRRCRRRATRCSTHASAFNARRSKPPVIAIRSWSRTCAAQPVVVGAMVARQFLPVGRCACADAHHARPSGDEGWHRAPVERRDELPRVKGGGGSWFGEGNGQSPMRQQQRVAVRKAASAMIAKIPEPLSRHITAGLPAMSGHWSDAPPQGSLRRRRASSRCRCSAIQKDRGSKSSPGAPALLSTPRTVWIYAVSGNVTFTSTNISTAGPTGGGSIEGFHHHDRTARRVIHFPKPPSEEQTVLSSPVNGVFVHLLRLHD